jgi:toxin FitB
MAQNQAARFCSGLVERRASQQASIPSVVARQIQDGVQITRMQHPAKTEEIESWLDSIVAVFAALPVDGTGFREWARLMAGKSYGQSEDAMNADTPLPLRLSVVTCNVGDFELFNVQVFNPLAYPREETNWHKARNHASAC